MLDNEIKPYRLFDLFCITDEIIIDYYNYNSSLIGINDLMFKIYSGIYEVYDINREGYFIVFKIRDIAEILFISNKGSYFNLLKLIKHKNELMDKYKVNKIYFKLDKNDLKKNRIISRISKEQYMSYIIERD